MALLVNVIFAICIVRRNCLSTAVAPARLSPPQFKFRVTFAAVFAFGLVMGAAGPSAASNVAFPFGARVDVQVEPTANSARPSVVERLAEMDRVGSDEVQPFEVSATARYDYDGLDGCVAKQRSNGAPLVMLVRANRNPAASRQRSAAPCRYDAMPLLRLFAM